MLLKISNTIGTSLFCYYLRNKTLLNCKLFSFRFALPLLEVYQPLELISFNPKKLLQYKILRVSWNGYLHKLVELLKKCLPGSLRIKTKNLSWHIYQNKLTEKQEITKGKFVMMQIGKSVYCSIKMCI